jgi:hypothetical protein
MTHALNIWQSVLRGELLAAPQKRVSKKVDACRWRTGCRTRQDFDTPRRQHE